MDNTNNLPPLPLTKSQYGFDHTPAFTAQQMWDYARAVLAAERQRLAALADAHVTYCPTCCQGFEVKTDLTHDEVIFQCGKAAGRSETSRAMVAAAAEPVAWMVYTQDGQSVYVTDNPRDIQPGQQALPLYTTPTTGGAHG